MIGKNGGPPITKEVIENDHNITRARNLIQMKLSQLPSFIAIAERETGYKFNPESHGDQATLMMRFASHDYGWAQAFDLWENNLANSSKNRSSLAKKLDHEYGCGWNFQTDNQADHEALLKYFEVESLVLPLEKGAINLREIFEQVKEYRDKIYRP